MPLQRRNRKDPLSLSRGWGFIMKKMTVGDHGGHEGKNGPFPKPNEIAAPKERKDPLRGAMPKEGRSVSDQKREGKEEGWMLPPKEPVIGHERVSIHTETA